MVGQDLRYGARLLGKAPGFTGLALAALALGIGATTSIFSVVYAVLWKPLPFRDAERLLVIYEKNPSMNRFRLLVSPGNLWEWQRQSRTLEGIAAIQQGVHANLSGGPNGAIEPEELHVERVSAGLFPLLGVQPVVGRAFRDDEDRPGHTNFALLSHALWQRRFASDPAISGKAIRLRDQSYTVVGVLPAGFTVLDAEVDVWVPLGLNPADTRANAGRLLTVIARMKPGVTIDRVRGEMDSIGARLEAADPALDAGWRPSVFPFRDELVAFRDERMGNTRRALTILLGAVGFLLLMACANVANLLLARGAGRRREIAIRTALGASRARIVAQLLAESVLLSVTGGIVGLALAFGITALVRSLGPAIIPRLSEVRIDAGLLLFALALSLVTGLLFGVAPALQVTGGNLNESLIEGGRGGTATRAGRFLRSLLVVAEVTIAVVLLIGAGLLIQSFTRLRATNPGFQPAGLLTFRLPLAGRATATAERRIAFLDQATGRIAHLPGVRSAAAVSTLPLTGFGVGSNFNVEGRPAGFAEQKPLALVRSITPDYFHTIGIPLLAGREFSAADRRGSQPVIVVNQTMARRLWGTDAKALGNSVHLDHVNNGWTAQVVGVAGNVNPERIQDEEWQMVYVPYAQSPLATMVVVARAVGSPMSVASAVTREIHQMEPEQPVSEVKPMEDVLDRSTADSRFNALVLAIFAAIAFVLAAVGIYGVISYGVAERTHELGIRMALGAQREDISKLVLGGAARLAAAGIGAGLVCAFALTRLMTAMLYGVKPTDFYTYAAIAILLGGVALAASYLPSRRAMALDPIAALRHE